MSVLHTSDARWQSWTEVELTTTELEDPVDMNGKHTYSLPLMHRNIHECVEMIFCNPAFAGHLKYKSTNDGKYHEACSGDAWKSAEEGMFVTPDVRMYFMNIR